jgi:hypothetical protein
MQHGGDLTTEMHAPDPVPEPSASELSPLFESTDAAAIEAKRRVQRLTALRLAFLVLAALGGATDLESGGRNWSGVLAAVSFAVALLLEVELHRSGARRSWLHSRMIAEAVRTIAWRYAVGAPPFRVGDAAADTRLLDELGRVAEFMRESDVEVTPSVGPSLTDWMRNIRSMEWPRRADFYLKARLNAQQEFLRRQAHAAKQAAERWGLAMLLLEAVGVGGGVLKAAGILRLDTLGITAALIAAIGAWLEMNQHNAVANSYGISAVQLPVLASRLQLAESEGEWRLAVDASEREMNAERTSWGGTHGVALPLETDRPEVSDRGEA